MLTLIRHIVYEGHFVVVKNLSLSFLVPIIISLSAMIVTPTATLACSLAPLPGPSAKRVFESRAQYNARVANFYAQRNRNGQAEHDISARRAQAYHWQESGQVFVVEVTSFVLNTELRLGIPEWSEGVIAMATPRAWIKGQGNVVPLSLVDNSGPICKPHWEPTIPNLRVGDQLVVFAGSGPLPQTSYHYILRRDAVTNPDIALALRALQTPSQVE